MRVLTRRFGGLTRSDVLRLYPLADPHIGTAACDEKRLTAWVRQVADDDGGYWLGLGDYCEFVLKADKRFDAGSLASWVRVPDLVDITRAERDRFLDIIAPICTPGKCLGLVEGNHEYAIKQRFERDVYSEIVTTVKQRCGLPDSEPLGFGVTGWLILRFTRGSPDDRGGGSSTIRVNLHHGFVGGKLAGAKALNMQRWLWSHDCDLALMGHSHVIEVQAEAIERVRGRQIVNENRIGAFCGAFLNGPTTADSYVERKGYFPTPSGHIVVKLQPCVKDISQRIRIQL